MISFTPRFVLLFLAGAACVLLAYVMPWVMFAVVIYISFLVCLAILDFAFPGARLTVERRFEERVGLGREVPVTLLFVNTGGRTLRCEAEDTPPEQTRHEIQCMRFSVPPGQTVERSYTITPLRRGDRTFGVLFLRVEGPMGLVRRRSELSIQRDTVKVFPDLSEYRKYELLIQKGYFFMPGVRPLRFRGQGTTFERMREYLPDDNYQHINWKATARLSKPIVEEYEVEKNQNIFIMIDVGRLMSLEIFGYTKLDYVLRTALVLATVCTLKGDNVGILAFSRDVVRYLPPHHGRPHLIRCMDALYNLEATEYESDYARAFEFLLAKKLKRSLIVVFSDLIDLQASETLIRYLSLLSPRHLPMCVTMNDSDIMDAAAAFPEDMDALYRKTAAMSLLDKRNAVFRRLTRRGVSIIDTRPEKLSSDVIQRYLELKSRLLV